MLIYCPHPHTCPLRLPDNTVGHRCAVAHLFACLAALWEWSVVLHVEYVARGIIAVGVVHDDGLVGHDLCTHGLGNLAHLRKFSSVELFLPNIITIYISNSIYFKLITIN